MNLIRNKVMYEGQHDKDPDYYLIGLNTNFIFPMHFHRCFEITLVLEGKMEVCCETEKFTLNAGDMIFVGSNIIHEQITVEYSKAFICIFSPDVVAAVAPKFLKYPLKSPVLRNVSEYCRTTFEMLHDNYLMEISGEQRRENPAIVKGVLYTLMSYFYDQLNMDVSSSYGDRHALLGTIFAYVEENKESSCTLNDMAENLNYSPVYLSRFFRENTGVPFHTYVRMVKMNHACWLLKATRDSVLDIAMRCGYSSVSSFNRSFQQLIGMRPLDYRKL